MKENIVCIDTETTGLDKTKDRIIQLAAVRFNNVTKKIVSAKSWYILPTGYFQISEAAQAIHGISKEILEEKGVKLKDIFPEFMELLEDADILTYNGNTFDLAFIQREFEREMLDPKFYEHKFIDSYDIEKRNHSNKLADVYKRYYGKDFEDAHDALADVKATIDVFVAQQERIPQPIMEESIDESTKIGQISPEGFVKFRDGQLIFSVGKYKEISVATVCQKDPGYIRWLFKPNNGENVITIPTKRAIEEDWYKYKQSHNL